MAFKARTKAVICRKIAGGKTIREVCRQAEMPSHETVHRWLRTDDKFACALQSARRTAYRRLERNCVKFARQVTANSTKEDWENLYKLQWELGKRRAVLKLDKQSAPPECRASWRRTVGPKKIFSKKWIDPLEKRWRKKSMSVEETIAFINAARERATASNTPKGAPQVRRAS